MAPVLRSESFWLQIGPYSGHGEQQIPSPFMSLRGCSHLGVEHGASQGCLHSSCQWLEEYRGLGEPRPGQRADVGLDLLAHSSFRRLMLPIGYWRLWPAICHLTAFSHPLPLHSSQRECLSDLSSILTHREHGPALSVVMEGSLSCLYSAPSPWV